MKKQEEIYKKKRCEFPTGKDRPENRFKIEFGRVLGSIWEAFGTVWGLFLAILGASGSFGKGSRSSFDNFLEPNGSTMGSKRPFKSILVDLG